MWNYHRHTSTDTVHFFIGAAANVYTWLGGNATSSIYVYFSHPRIRIVFIFIPVFSVLSINPYWAATYGSLVHSMLPSDFTVVNRNELLLHYLLIYLANKNIIVSLATTLDFIVSHEEEKEYILSYRQSSIVLLFLLVLKIK